MLSCMGFSSFYFLRITNKHPPSHPGGKCQFGRHSRIGHVQSHLEEKVMIDRLLNTSGKVRQLLGMPEDSGILDLSDFDWKGQFEVVRGVKFDRTRLASVTISTNFVECTFENCEFSKIRSHGHFSAAGNTWQRCRFNKLTLIDLIAPQSRFIDCEFRDVSIRGFHPCQTLFDQCHFANFSVGGLRCQIVGNKSMQLPEIVRTGASTLFRTCRFDSGAFTGCYFADICFENCAVADTRFIDCDFRGTVGSDMWWRQIPSGDPFHAFLRVVLQGIEKRLGRSSRAFVAFSAYAADYQQQKTQSRDFSACLYDGSVPNNELDAIESIIDDAVEAFPP
ncbi:MAG: hypothetical protein K8T91_17635 [Planctomycetes bacterium]|nr:hypothetical protein [Planctomycetota bacterium]